MGVAGAPNTMPHYTRLQHALKQVGIGKRGSTILSSATAAELAVSADFTATPSIAKGAFLAALLFKKPAPTELELLHKLSAKTMTSASQLAKLPAFKGLFAAVPAQYCLAWLSREDPALVKEWLQAAALNRPLSAALAELNNVLSFIGRLLMGAELSLVDAEVLGDFLLADKTAASAGAEFLRGFCVSFLRVRYETTAEWCGVYRALAETVRPLTTLPPLPAARNFTKLTPTPFAATVLTMAEPMNGFTGSAFLSPLIAWWCHQYFALPTLHLSGDNPGPKFGFNFKELSIALDMPALSHTTPPSVSLYAQTLLPHRHYLGASIWLADIAPSLHAWVERRRRIIKRPLWASLEKFVRPIKTGTALPLKRLILLTSAFHGPYFLKMRDLAQFAGYDAFIITKLGMEGGLGAALSRPLQLLAAVRTPLGNYQEKLFSVSYAAIGLKRRLDTRTVTDVTQNVMLITKWLEHWELVVNQRQFSNTTELYELVCESAELHNSLAMQSDDALRYFAERLRVSLFVYTQAFQWIAEQWAE